jgi:hypothetical protein
MIGISKSRVSERLDMRTFLFRWFSPSSVKDAGLWLIIGALLADGAVIFWVPSPTDKPLSFICDLAIALGVWVEHIGAGAKEAPRVLTAEQRARITEKVKQFAGQEFVGSVAPGAGDALPLWRQIAGALRDANWTLAPPPAMSVDNIVPVGLAATTSTAVGILISPHGFMSSPALLTHAEALAGALNEEGIAAFAFTYDGPTVKTMPNTIKIVIGLKP